MKVKVKQTHSKKKPRNRRADLERSLGRKLLKGEIPVVPPKILRCPAPNSPEFDDTCKQYEQGKISYDDVLTKVGESMKKPEPKPEPSEVKTDGV